MKTATKLKKKRKNGFLIRMKTKSGQRIINLKRKKRRKQLIK
nr:ribosomal protein L34 [Echinothamnion sp.]